MKIILIIVVIIAMFTSYFVGYEHGISITSTTISELIEKSISIEDLKKKIKEHYV